MYLNGVDLNNTFSVSYEAPSITYNIPNITYIASLLYITGPDFGSAPSPVQVVMEEVSTQSTFNCSNSVWQNSSFISCVIPDDLPSGNFSIFVVFGNQTASNRLYGLNVLPPVITSISPTQGPSLGGESVILVVQNLFELERITFSSNSYEVTRIASNCYQTSASTVNCTTPAVPISGVYNISISTGVLSGPQFFGYTYDAANVNKIRPNNGTGAGGDQISIIGSNFGTGCCVTATVTFGPNVCQNAERVNDSLITCISPAVSIT